MGKREVDDDLEIDASWNDPPWAGEGETVGPERREEGDMTATLSGPTPDNVYLDVTEDGDLKCPYCNVIARDIRALANHINGRSNSTDDHETIGYGNMKFNSIADWFRAQTTKRKKGLKYLLEGGRKPDVSKHLLDEMRTKVESEGAEKLRMALNGLSEYRTLGDTQQTTEEQHVCDNCDEAFESKHALSGHMAHCLTSDTTEGENAGTVCVELSMDLEDAWTAITSGDVNDDLRKQLFEKLVG